MLAQTQLIFNNITETMSSKDMINIMDQYEDAYLVVIMINEGVEFIGEISDYNKQLIKKAFTLNDFYEIANGIYRMVLKNTIYIFKKFGEETKTVLVGVLAEKNEENRIDILDRQTNYLLNKCKDW